MPSFAFSCTICNTNGTLLLQLSSLHKKVTHEMWWSCPGPSSYIVCVWICVHVCRVLYTQGSLYCIEAHTCMYMHGSEACKEYQGTCSDIGSTISWLSQHPRQTTWWQDDWIVTTCPLLLEVRAYIQWKSCVCYTHFWEVDDDVGRRIA